MSERKNETLSQSLNLEALSISKESTRPTLRLSHQPRKQPKAITIWNDYVMQAQITKRQAPQSISNWPKIYDKTTISTKKGQAKTSIKTRATKDNWNTFFPPETQQCLENLDSVSLELSGLPKTDLLSIRSTISASARSGQTYKFPKFPRAKAQQNRPMLKSFQVQRKMDESTRQPLAPEVQPTHKSVEVETRNVSHTVMQQTTKRVGEQVQKDDEQLIQENPLCSDFQRQRMVKTQDRQNRARGPLPNLGPKEEQSEDICSYETPILPTINNNMDSFGNLKTPIIQKQNKHFLNRVFRVICRDNQYQSRPIDAAYEPRGTTQDSLRTQSNEGVSHGTMFNRNHDINMLFSGRY